MTAHPSRKEGTFNASKKNAAGNRSVKAEVDVPGTPEEVWNAIATGPGISVFPAAPADRWLEYHSAKSQMAAYVRASDGMGGRQLRKAIISAGASTVETAKDLNCAARGRHRPRGLGRVYHGKNIDL